MPKKENSAIFEIFVIKTDCFTSVVLTNVFSLWKHWQSEVNKLFCTWRKRMTQLCIILSRILLISNSMVSRVIWKNTYSSVFQKPQIAFVFPTRVILILTCACFFFSKWHSKPCYYLYYLYYFLGIPVRGINFKYL